MGVRVRVPPQVPFAEDKMKVELQNKLFEKYPKIFRQKDLPMQQTCMCWGITCGDGWYNIIDTLCSEIQHHLEYNAERNQGPTLVEATQVKEKFGGLRFYYDGGDVYNLFSCKQ